MALDAAALAKLVDACLRDRMRAKPYPTDVRLIRRCLGLDPLPPRTDLRVERLGSAEGDGWLREQFSFESQPGLRVPALTYVPSASGPRPLLVLAADEWEGGRRAAWAQAFGIGFALRGYAVAIIDPPGWADREAMGDSRDLSLSAALPSLGVYAWDLMRTIDFAVAELGALAERVGMVGVGTGGQAALAASAMDDRVVALAVSGAGHYRDAGEDLRLLSGVADLGDWANLVVHRAPLPILFLAAEEDEPERVEELAKRLRGSYRGKQQAGLRVERFLGKRDLNRRMREAAAAFFAEHLERRPAAPYSPEPLPLTDGQHNPRPANTEPADALSTQTPSKTLAELRDEALAHPYPEGEPDLVPWGKYGRLDPLPEVETLKLVDHGESPNVVVLPSVEPAQLVPLGLSVPDFFAQLLHLLLPGGPEGWEPLALQGDALTAMIASVRTLMKKAESKAPPTRIEAEGPIASLTARLLKLSRPDLEITVTHEPGSWTECIAQGILIPGARYRSWPWAVLTAPALPGMDTAPESESPTDETPPEAIQWTADDESPEAPDASLPAEPLVDPER